MNGKFEINDIAETANAIRFVKNSLGVNASNEKYKCRDLQNEVRGIIDLIPPSPSGTKSITSNGEYDIASFAKVFVNVSSEGSQESPYDFEIKTGTYIPSEDTIAMINASRKTQLVINHGLAHPIGFVFWLENTADSSLNEKTSIISAFCTKYIRGGAIEKDLTGAITQNIVASKDGIIPNTVENEDGTFNYLGIDDTSFWLSGNGTPWILRGGWTYKYIAFGAKGE